MRAISAEPPDSTGVVGLGLLSLVVMGCGVLSIGVGASCVLLLDGVELDGGVLDIGGRSSYTVIEPFVVDNSSKKYWLSLISTLSKVSGVVPAPTGLNVKVAIVMFPLYV